jgi:hypothetical protein
MDIQHDPPVAIVVMDPDQRPSGQDTDPQLLFQLPRQSPRGCLPRLELTAWKFPKPALMHPLGTPGDQHPPLSILDGTGDDMDVGHGSRAFLSV